MPGLSVEYNVPNSSNSSGRISIVTPHDVNDLTFWARSIRAPSDGNIRILTVGDDDIIHPVRAGERIPGLIKRVFLTSTTVTGSIIAYH